MTTKMTTERRNHIRKIIDTLIRIDKGDRFFYNVTMYENLGLIKSRKVYGIHSSGNKVVIRHTQHLTAKAKQFITVVI